MSKLNHNIRYLSLLAILPFVFAACNPTKKLGPGERLLHKNHIINKDTKLDNNDIESYIRQKPNRKIFLIFRFHLWLYNQANEDRIKRKRILYDKKKQRKNERRIAKGKKPKKYDRQLFGEWLLNIGEAPIAYDSMLAAKSARQIKSFLNNKGYFISSVSDSVHYKRKKADVYYTVRASEPYTINNIEYKIPDEQLAYYVLSDTANRRLRKGNNYDVDVFQSERERITSELNNNGYFFFTKDYVYYEVDTTIGSRQVNITLGIKNFAKKYAETSDSIIETPHRRYYVNNIYIEPDFVAKKFDNVTKDTLKVDDYTIIHSKKLRYKTKVLLGAIFIRKGELYQFQNVEDSYKRLSELKAFKTINISFEQAKGDYLDCHIQLSPIYKQSFTVETVGTNTSGNLGISSSIVFQNRNLLRGAEVLELRLKGGIAAQQVFGTSGATDNIEEAANQFNTIEFGPELNVTIPRFLLPFRVRISKKANPKTIFTSSMVYQRRPDYTRYITNLAFGYNWRESAKKRHTINPLVINFVKVDLSPTFLNYLEENIHDRYTLNSFSNHLATSTVYTFTYNEQDLNKDVNFSFFKMNAESSGNILRGLYNSVNYFQPGTFKMDDQGRYKLMDIVYSQYLRIDGDYRYYFNANEINKVVFRIAAGIGVPLKNFTSLPFERSFFSGGANGIRAWQARTLGPGSYADDGTFSFDQFGDGQLEGNIEYRFKLFRMLNGAFFVDGGNVWLREKNASKPGAEFEFNRFYKEIAVGSGFGLRADFSFFVLRLDMGVKVRDPQFSEQKRWIIGNLFNPVWKMNYRDTHNNRKYNFLVFNIGINYPF
ncbi:MAG: outer membrane protein assembly complex, YaeT protein [Bacteroidota bacterium]|nr:outer membrane protein assembly complex, YaeT protein [Bacteroidota bacterium]